MFDAQVPPDCVLDNVVVEPIQKDVVPVDATGAAKGVNVIIAESVVVPQAFNATYDKVTGPVSFKPGV